MNRLIYNSGSLFEAEKNSILIHAVNAQGVWGSGIAKEFKERFPVEYQSYRDYCFDYHIARLEDSNLTIVGEALIVGNVGCLITSENYGKLVDSPESILAATATALEMLYELDENIHKEYHSNKFNSGLFATPWEDTEKIIKAFLERHPEITWNVWVP